MNSRHIFLRNVWFENTKTLKFRNLQAVTGGDWADSRIARFLYETNWSSHFCLIQADLLNWYNIGNTVHAGCTTRKLLLLVFFNYFFPIFAKLDHFWSCLINDLYFLQSVYFVIFSIYMKICLFILFLKLCSCRLSPWSQVKTKIDWLF